MDAIVILAIGLGIWATYEHLRYRATKASLENQKAQAILDSLSQQINTNSGSIETEEDKQKALEDKIKNGQ